MHEASYHHFASAREGTRKDSDTLVNQEGLLGDPPQKSWLFWTSNDLKGRHINNFTGGSSVSEGTREARHRCGSSGLGFDANLGAFHALLATASNKNDIGARP